MAVRTPGLQDRNSFPRDWGNYNKPAELPNAAGAPLGAPQFDHLEEGDTAYIFQAGVAGRYWCVKPGASGAGDAVWATAAINDSYTPLVAASDGGTYAALEPFRFQRIGNRVRVTGTIQCTVQGAVGPINLTWDTPTNMDGTEQILGTCVYCGVVLSGYDPGDPGACNAGVVFNGPNQVLAATQSGAAVNPVPGDIFTVDFSYSE